MRLVFFATLLVTSACASRMARINSVSGGAEAGEFYVVTYSRTWNLIDGASDHTNVLRCLNKTAGDDNVTVCVHVLDERDALDVADREAKGGSQVSKTRKK